MDKDKETPSDSVQIKINFRVPSRMPSVYAHHMTIQPGEHEVVVSFYEIIPPLVTEDTEVQLKLLQEVGVIAECVARITVAKDRFSRFATAMQQISSQMSSDQSETEEEQSNADSSRNNQ